MSATVTVRVVPLSGTPTEVTVPFKKGMTVNSALTAAGVSSDKRDLSVEAAPGQTLKSGQTVVVTDKVKAGGQVTVRERPQGS
ncbi:hypothetical protein HQ487_00255 [Candidatus Uhrbacteria bacterium]|nr:hypothetical protein [Candidatus Uhrbacteria bacterium]